MCIAEAMEIAALDHDFNNTWGTTLGVTELSHRPVASALMKEYWDDPVRSKRAFTRVLSQYTDMFEQVSRPIVANLATKN